MYLDTTPYRALGELSGNPLGHCEQMSEEKIGSVLLVNQFQRLFL